MLLLDTDDDDVLLLNNGTNLWYPRPVICVFLLIIEMMMTFRMGFGFYFVHCASTDTLRTLGVLNPLTQIAFLFFPHQLFVSAKLYLIIVAVLLQQFSRYGCKYTSLFGLVRV